MSYTKVGWKDYPDTTTPITADRLNHMDDQIANNADDIDDIKEDISDLKATDADLQTQINNKTVDDLNVREWNNFISPRWNEQKQIGTYFQDDQPHFQILYSDTISNPRQSEYSFTLPEGMSGNRARVTGVTGVFVDSDGVAYPVNYNYDGKKFIVRADETQRTLDCIFAGMQFDANTPWKIRLMVTYTN